MQHLGNIDEKEYRKDWRQKLASDRFVSVIVPVYNAEKYLKTCLDSIAKQSYKKMEVILVNDCSKDNSGLICDEYVKRFSTFKVIHKLINEGVAAARNSALDIATGEYLMFIDSDDWIEHGMFKTCVGLLNKYSADMVQCSNYYAYKKFAKYRAYDASTIKLSTNESIVAAYANEKISPTVWGKMYKRSLFDSIRFLTVKCGGDDFQMMPKILSEVNNSVIIINIPMYYYRILNESLSHKPKSLERCVFLHKAHKEYDKWITKNCPSMGYMGKYRCIANAVSVIVGLENENNINEKYIQRVTKEAMKMYVANRKAFNYKQRFILKISLRAANSKLIAKVLKIYAKYFNYGYNINFSTFLRMKKRYYKI